MRGAGELPENESPGPSSCRKAVLVRRDLLPSPIRFRVASWTDSGLFVSIRFSRDAPSSSGRSLSFRTEMIRCPQMSSIKYHRPSHRMMLTSREPDHSCGLYLFSPPLSGVDDERPQWLLGESMHKRLSTFGVHTLP